MPATDTFSIQTTPVIIGGSPSEPKLVKNIGGGTIYYKTTNDVSAASYDSTLASGSALTLTGTKWFICAASAPATVQVSAVNEADPVEATGPPKSGTNGTGVGNYGKGQIYIDTTNGVQFINEGSITAPYWSPLPLEQPGLVSVGFNGAGIGAGKALADTGAQLVLPGNGIRVFGQGMTENGDSGFIQGATGTEGAQYGVLHVTNEASHLSALGTEAGIMQPDTHQLLVVDVEFCDNADILTSSVFCGFIGTAADALDPVVTGATTTITLVLDDLAGIYSNAGMTDVNGYFLTSEKSNTAGTQTSVTAAADRPVAGTYHRLRVECDSTGKCTAFFDKAQIGVIPGATGAAAHSTSTTALDADEEVSPVFYIENGTTTTRTANVRRFSAWCYHA